MCESRGDRPGLPSLINPTVSVDVKQHSAALVNSSVYRTPCRFCRQPFAVSELDRSGSGFQQGRCLTTEGTLSIETKLHVPEHASCNSHAATEVYR